MMLRTLGDHYVNDVVTMNTACEVWEYLEQRILGSHQNQLLQAIHDLAHVKFRNLDQLVRKFRKTASIVVSLDQSFTGHQLVLLFLS